jgi:alpha-L-rhamnosidase
MAWLACAGLLPNGWAAPRSKAAVQVTDLRCEYLKDPLGIDVRRPRLSWKLVATDPRMSAVNASAPIRVLVARSAYSPGARGG